MTRTLSAAVEQELAREGRERIHLIALHFAEGTVRFNSTANPIEWDGETWLGAGGIFGFRGVEESAQVGGHSLDVLLSGLNPWVVTPALEQTYIGRRAELYLAYLHAVTKQLLDEPLLVYRGDMNGGWSMRGIAGDIGEPGTVEITCTLKSRTDRLNYRNGFQTNMPSHQAVFPGDRFFEFVGTNASRPLVLRP